MKLISIIRKVTSAIKNRMFFKKMIITYILCTSLVFLGFTFMISSSIHNNYMKSINQLNDKALYQSANTCSVTLENLYNYFYVDSLENIDVIKLLYADHYNSDLSISSSRVQNKLLGYNNLVSSFYLINFRGNFVCTNLDTYDDIDSFFDKDIIDKLASDEYSKKIYTNIPREIQFEISSITYKNKYITMIFRKFDKGFLVINLNYEKFSEMVNYNSYNRDSQTLVMNSDGYVLADSNSTMFGMQMSSNSLYQELMNQKSSSGSYTSIKNGSKMLINYRKDEMFGIVYLTLTQHHLLDKNNPLLLQSILYSVIAIIISLIMIISGSWFLYKPINELRNTIGYKNNNTEQDEFSYINSSFEAIKKDFHVMKKNSNEYYKSNRKQILKELLYTGSTKSISSDLAVLSDDLNKNSFVIVNVYFDFYDTLINDQQENFLLLKYAIENIFLELLPNYYSMEIVDCNKHLASIINYNTSAALAIHASDYSHPVYDPAVNKQQMHELEHILQKLQHLFYQYYSVNISLSIGTIVNNLLDISESYQNAETASLYQITNQANAINYYSNLRFDEPELQQYPFKQEKAILEAIKNGEEDRLTSSVKEFFQIVYHYNHNQIILFILTLHTALERMEDKCNITYPDKDIVISLAALQNEKLCKLVDLFTKRCHRSLGLYHEIRANNSIKNEIIEQIFAIIDKNIANPDLSVDTIAEEVHLSNSYLRAIFKEYTGNTLTNYIIERRLEQICTLLRDTDLSVQKIADQLGFSSRNYVFTFFKNYMGITPNQYRMQNSDKKLN